MDAPRPLDCLLRPHSVAIVGASTDDRAFGSFVLGNLRRFGYRGQIHPVSRSSTEIDGIACVRTVDALPQDIDLAVLAIPEAGVGDAIRALGARRCRAAVVFASGYSEAGDEGRAKQEALAAAVADAGMLLLGPNCMGFTNYAHALALTFEPLQPVPSLGPDRPGVGIAAQSGAMAATIRDALLGRGINLHCVCSTGNEVSVCIEDVLDDYLDDPAIRVVAIYAEQLRRPDRFLSLARRARALGKPIVLLMSGRSARGREAAASHTGALAGDHPSALAHLRREAVAVVDTLDELFDTTAILLAHPRPGTGGTAFITGSGAMKNLALDFADDIALELPALTEATTASLAAKLPAYAIAENPLDYTTIGVRQPGLIGELIHTMIADPGIGSAVLCIPVGPSVAQRDKAEYIVPALQRATKPTVLVLSGDTGPIEAFFLDAIRAAGVPLFRSADRALRAMKRVAQFGEALARAARADEAIGDAADAHVAAALPGPVPSNGIFAEYLGKAWLADAGIPVPDGALARELAEAETIAQRIGYPVVLKAQASELPHKSDAGGVILGLADAAALRAGWAVLQRNLAARRPGLALDGVLVEPMGPRGLELVVGARRDPDWGVVVLVGLGGVWIETLADVRVLAPDLAEADIVEELRRLKAAPLLAGTRGAPAVDVGAIARVASVIGRRMLADPRLVEIDVNPLVAYPDRVLALDALLVARGDAR
ncbi:MAG: acetate--CoA ligase family protein [Lautropia sp.]